MVFFASHLALRDDGCRHVGRCCAGRKLSRCPCELWNDSHHVCSDHFHGEPCICHDLPIRVIQTLLHHESKDTAPRALHQAVQYSFAHYGSTVMQVSINAQHQLVVDRHSNSLSKRERERERERECLQFVCCITLFVYFIYFIYLFFLKRWRWDRNASKLIKTHVDGVIVNYLN